MDEIEAKLKEKVDRFTHAVHRLSPDQRLVLKHAAQGLDNETIARELGVPLTTILGRMHTIYQVAQIPGNVGSRWARRQIIVGLYKGFAEKHDVDRHGFITAKPVVVQAAPPMPPQLVAPLATIPESNMPLANGHAEAAHEPEKDVAKPALLPAKVVPGYGVGLTVTFPDPASIVDIVAITLGTPEAPEKLQELLREGYVPEIMNDFQSLTGSRGVTKVVLIKRK